MGPTTMKLMGGLAWLFRFIVTMKLIISSLAYSWQIHTQFDSNILSQKTRTYKRISVDGKL